MYVEVSMYLYVYLYVLVAVYTVSEELLEDSYLG